MSAKRPRPAIPVLVHVDNPTEAASVVVDTSTIEGKMDTVINNQNRIYDKIPTSSGGSSADLTTVNANTTALATAIGSTDSTTGDNDLLGLVSNLRSSIGIFGTGIPLDGTTVKSFLFNLRSAIGNAENSPTTTGNTVRDLLTAIKENTTSSTDLTTVNEKITSLATSIGPASSASSDNNIFGHVRNLHYAVGDVAAIPTTTDTSVRGLLTAIKAATGYTNSTAADSNLLGGVKNLIGSIGDSSGGLFLKDKTIRALLYNVREGIGDYNTALNTNGTTVRALLYNTRDAIGSSYDTPTATGTTVRDLLTAIKENTASGGSGGSADLTTVNEKTTALAAAIGSASDDSSTVSVIGLLKSITDKY